MGDSPASVLSFLYRFKRPGGEAQEFNVRLDGKTLAVLPEPKNSYPEWTKLSHCQCPNCPLKAAEHPRCPIAANLSEIVEIFKDAKSFEPVEIEIRTEARTYTKQATLAEGLRSLIGIYMVTSGCPILDRLKPMVRTHLPFATWEETLYRAIGTYLLAQYFVFRCGGEPDWEMRNLADVYEDIRVVNKSFCERLRTSSIRDATLNAVLQLDSFADLTSMTLQRKRFDEIQKLFSAYLTTEP